jgi:NTP pyrophosphatase (non-canonical NTP hydrolase)
MALDPIHVPSDLPLGKLQEEVHEWIANHGVRYFNELTNMAQLTEEVGEVARIIARRYVLFVVLCLANQTGTDLQAAFDKKMNVKRERDHDRHHNNEKLK